jgi:hypothetical protein
VLKKSKIITSNLIFRKHQTTNSFKMNLKNKKMDLSLKAPKVQSLKVSYLMAFQSVMIKLTLMTICNLSLDLEKKRPLKQLRKKARKAKMSTFTTMCFPVIIL